MAKSGQTRIFIPTSTVTTPLGLSGRGVRGAVRPGGDHGSRRGRVRCRRTTVWPRELQTYLWPCRSCETPISLCLAKACEHTATPISWWRCGLRVPFPEWKDLGIVGDIAAVYTLTGRAQSSVSTHRAPCWPLDAVRYSHVPLPTAF